MTVPTFIITVAAVLLGNLLSGVLVYGLWRATRAEKNLGGNGLDALPLPLLLAMCAAPGIMLWGGLLLD